jgi:hypothetical protein
MVRLSQQMKGRTVQKVPKLNVCRAMTLATAALFAGCSLAPRTTERIPKNAADIGTVGVAVVSAAPFELFVKDLEPGFEIDGKKALELVTATTRQVEDTYIQSLQALVKLAPGQLSGTRESSTSTDADGKTTSTSSSTSSSSAGDLSKVVGPTIPATTLPGALPGGSAPAGVNPMLSHLLATALLQEVKLLNKYVRTAPTLRDHTQFIVRMQLNVRQLGRNTPYNAEIDIAFNKGVVAVPLLLSDSIDIASASTARGTIRSLGVGLAALRGNFDLGLDVGSRAEGLLRALGSEFNSVLSVGQTPGKTNSISVQVGANEKGVDKHELLTRSHLVTMLLLVPNEPRNCVGQHCISNLEFTPKVTFRHARDAGSTFDAEKTLSTAFELAHWPTPRMPGEQLARVLLSGKSAPYAGKVTLRGGDALVKGMFDRVCLRDADATKFPDQPRLCEGEYSLQSTGWDAAEDRNSLEANFDLLGVSTAKKEGKPAAAQKEQMPTARGKELTHVCFETPKKYGPHKLERGSCVAVSAQVLEATEPESELSAKVTVGESRLIADRDGRASLSMSVAFPKQGDKDFEKRPARVEIDIGGAGLLAIDSVDRSAKCAQAGAGVVVTSDCSFVLRLANAAPGQRVSVAAVGIKPGGKDRKEIKEPIAPSASSLEVVLLSPELAVVLQAVRPAAHKPLPRRKAD